jgi:hypothetical protein
VTHPAFAAHGRGGKPRSAGQQAIQRDLIYVEVVEPTRRVTAYGSVIDSSTQDPTYVPAQ